MSRTKKEFPEFSLNNKVALVTGSSKGLGKACALALANAGADIGLGLRDVNSARDLEEEIRKMGRKVIRLQMDVSKLNEINSAVEEVVRTFGKIDIVVNNVGIAPDNP